MWIEYLIATTIHQMQPSLGCGVKQTAVESARAAGGHKLMVIDFAALTPGVRVTDH